MLTDIQAKALYEIDTDANVDIASEIIDDLEDNGLIENGALTDAGKEKLANYINWLD